MNYIGVKLSKNISAMTKKIYSLHIVNEVVLSLPKSNILHFDYK